MADSANRRVALLSIRPGFADAILQGEKKVELRRVAFSEPISHVVVYATAPVQKVVGWFEVTDVDRAKPHRLWQRYRSVAGITASSFRRYYEGIDEGLAILVGDVTALATPIPLSALGISFPPQSFRYLTDDQLRFLPAVHSKRGSSMLYRLMQRLGWALRFSGNRHERPSPIDAKRDVSVLG